MPFVFWDDLPVLDVASSPTSAPVVFSSDAVVGQVVDGDTLRLGGVGWLKVQAFRGRLFGVDCAELDGSDPVLARAAVAYIESLIPGAPWGFTFHGLDVYGRFVVSEDHPLVGDVGDSLVSLSLAWALPMIPRPSPFGPPPLPAGNGRVQVVVDGDTHDIRLSLPLLVPFPEVRLFGVDAPEVGGPFSTIADSALLLIRLAALGLSCFVEVRGRDRYGRLLASVTAPGAGDLSARLISMGLGRSWDNPWPDRVLIGEPQRVKYLLA